MKIDILGVLWWEDIWILSQWKPSEDCNWLWKQKNHLFLLRGSRGWAGRRHCFVCQGVPRHNEGQKLINCHPWFAISDLNCPLNHLWPLFDTNSSLLSLLLMYCSEHILCTFLSDFLLISLTWDVLFSFLYITLSLAHHIRASILANRDSFPFWTSTALDSTPVIWRSYKVWWGRIVESAQSYIQKTCVKVNILAVSPNFNQPQICFSL
jgi:hypothetical protein